MNPLKGILGLAGDDEVSKAAVLLQKAAEDGGDAEDEDEEEMAAAAEGQAAEDDDEEEMAEDEDEEEMAEGGEDDEEAEASDSQPSAKASPAAKARKAERQRITAIVRSAAAKGRLEMALSLALDTELPADQACRVLENAPKAAAKGRLSQRMEGEANPRLGDGGRQPASADTVEAGSERLLSMLPGRRAR